MRSESRVHAASVLALCCALLLLPGVELRAQEEEQSVGVAESERSGAQEKEEQQEEGEEGKEQVRARFRQEIEVTTSHPQLPMEEQVSGREMEVSPDLDVVEHLRREAGVAAVRRGPVNLDPNVRGLVETQVAVVVDGTRTFAAGPARMDSDLAHVSPHAVERVRIVKGPYALTWAAGALGAIRLETFRPAFREDGMEVSGRVGARFGENASEGDGYAGVWGSDERWRFNLLANVRSGGDYEAGGSAGEIPGDYESRDLRWSLGYRPGPDTLVEYLGGYQSQEDIDYPGRLLDASFFKTRSHSLEVEHQRGDEGLARVFAQLYTNRKDHLMNNDEKPTAQPNPDRVPPFGIDVDLPTESNTAGGKVELGWRSAEATWNLGGDVYSVEQSARRFISNRDTGMLVFEDIVWPDAEIDDLGLYGQVVLAREGYNLAATLRLDLVDATAGEVSDFFADNTSGDLDQSETNLSAAVSARIPAGEGWLLTAGAGRAVRTASVLERYSDRFPSTKFQIAAEFVGDPDIDPEESLQLDLGAQYRGGAVSLDVDLFYRSIDDYITVMVDESLPKRLPLSPPSVFRYVNGDEARFYGGEARLAHRLTDPLSWRAVLSVVRGEDETFDEPAFGVAPAMLRLGARWQPAAGRYWIDLDLTLVEEQDRVAEARLEQPSPGYGVVDLRGGVAWGAWDLTLGLENLRDKRYSPHLNSLNPFTGERIPEVGRNLFVGVEYSF